MVGQDKLAADPSKGNSKRFHGTGTDLPCGISGTESAERNSTGQAQTFIHFSFTEVEKRKGAVLKRKFLYRQLNVKGIGYAKERD